MTRGDLTIFYPVCISGADQHREVGEITGHPGGVNGEPFAVGPAVLEGVAVGGWPLLDACGEEPSGINLIVILGLDPAGTSPHIRRTDFINDPICVKRRSGRKYMISDVDIVR